MPQPTQSSGSTMQRPLTRFGVNVSPTGYGSVLGPSSRLLSRTFRKPAISNPLRLVRCLVPVFQPREPAKVGAVAAAHAGFLICRRFFPPGPQFLGKGIFIIIHIFEYFLSAPASYLFWPSGLLFFSPSPTSLLILPHQPQRRGLPSSAVAFSHHSRSFFMKGGISLFIFQSQFLFPDFEGQNHAIQNGLGARRAARHIDIHRDIAVNRPFYGIALAENPAANRANSHGNRNLGFGNFIPYGKDAILDPGGQRACYQHNVGMARTAAISAAKALHVIAGDARRRKRQYCCRRRRIYRIS